MSKATTIPTTREEKPTPFYKRASFPWGILFSLMLLGFGFAAGWHTQHNLSQTIDTKAQAISARLK